MTIKRKISYGVKEATQDFGKMSFGELILTHRLCEDMSQVQFSKLLGVSKQYLCDIEKGRKIPSPERAEKFAKKLGMLPESFVHTALNDFCKKRNMKYLVKALEAAS